MFKTLKAASGHNGRVLNNFLSLSVVQFANYLAPLITLPYLFRVLGPSRYGLIELARAVSVYFLMLTDYGFSLSATREISVHREDPQRVSEVFSAVLLLKFSLTLLSFLMLSLIVFGVPHLSPDWRVYYLAFGHVVGMWLLPIWLFQGFERMKPIAVLNLAAKLLVIVCIFVFIRESDDYLYVPLLQSAGAVVIGLAGLVLALRAFPVRLYVPSLDVLTRELRNGWHLFIAKMATSLYTTSNIVILGLFTDSSFVAYYAAPDKIVRAVQGLQIPLSQAIFPHIGRLALQSRQAAMSFALKVARIVSVVTLLMSAGLFIGAPVIARVVLGEESGAGVPVIRILALLPFIVSLSNIFGVQIMVNLGLQKVLTRILIAAGVLNIIIALLLVIPMRHIGMAVAALVTETLVTVAMFVALRRSGLDLFKAGVDARSLSSDGVDDSPRQGAGQSHTGPQAESGD